MRQKIRFIRQKDNTYRRAIPEARSIKGFHSPETKCTIEIEEDTEKAAKKADVLIHLAVGPSTMIDTGDIKPQALVCDLSELKTIAHKARSRKDLIPVDCGSIRLPLGQKLGLHTGLPDNMICPYLAETMLLAFENKIVNYSLGENINLDNSKRSPIWR
jgi:predicted amino acid dehydrogenase